jgi:hypothetical protein
MQAARWQIHRSRRFIVLIAVAAITGVAHANFDTRSHAEQGNLLVPTPEHAQLWSLGFDAAVADYYWLRALAFVGGKVSRVESHGELIADLIDVITTIDPWVDHPYRFAAVWLTNDRKSVERGNALLERGISYHPLEWRNRYHLGFNHFFFLEQPLVAADYLETAIGLERAPSYLGPLVARLRGSKGGLRVAAAFLEKMAASTTDEYAQAQYLKALDEIAIEERARYLDAAREEYWRRHSRDIERVSDLVARPNPILRKLPRAQLHFDGFEWFLDPETGQITSSYYRARYRLHVTKTDLIRQKRWRTQRELEMEES